MQMLHNEHGIACSLPRPHQRGGIASARGWYILDARGLGLLAPLWLRKGREVQAQLGEFLSDVCVLAGARGCHRSSTGD